MIGKTISHYKILEKIGAGGMGVVYKAEDTALNRFVALKFLPSHLTKDRPTAERFRREAQAAAALNHPNIITIHEISEFEDQTYICMEYVAGSTLGTILDQGPMPVELALDYAGQIGEALKKAHKAEIVHRDIKPDNILIDDEGRVKILDFGLAKLRGVSKLTKDSSTLGTVSYMSPEQTKGDEVDHRTDIWSLGVVLYQMLTGRVPFEGDYDQAVAYAIVSDYPKPLSSVRPDAPSDLQRVLDSALEKDPGERYQHMDEILAALRTFTTKAGHDGSEGGRPGHEAHKLNKRRVASGVMIVALLVVCALVVWKWARRGGQEMPPQDQPRAPLQVTLKQVTFAKGVEESPAFSPDGSQIAYSEELAGYRHVFTKNLETGEEEQLTRGPVDNIQPTWSTDGKSILFVRSHLPDGKMEQGDIFGVHYGGDVWSLSLESNKEVKILENAFNPSFSPDGESIAFDASWGGTRCIWIANKFGRNPQQATTDSSETVSHIIPRWSPDGSKIVFQNKEWTKFDIKVVDAKSREMSWITRDAYQDLNPVWSGSGDAIFFSSYRSGGLNVWKIPISRDGAPTGMAQQVTAGAGEDVHLAISRDGRRLAMSILRQNADIWRLPVSTQTGMSTGDPTRLIATTREDSRGSWSADGSKIVFNSDRSGEMNIWIHDIAADSSWQITSGAGGDFQPNWSPDGAKIVFFSSRSGNADIWSVEVESGELERLTIDHALDINPFFSPDGNHIAYQSDRDGRRELWIMNADGTGQRRLTDSGVSGHFMCWTSDGQSIVYNSPSSDNRQKRKISIDGGDPELYAVVVGGAHMTFSPGYDMIMDVTRHRAIWMSPLAGGTPVKVFEFADPDVRIDYPVWSPDGMWILFDRVKPQGGDIWVMEISQPDL